MELWKATGSYRTYSIPGKNEALVLEFAVEDLPSAELHPRLLCLQWRTCSWGRWLVGISGSPIWSETLIERIFNPCGKFRWSPAGPVSKIRSPQLHADAPGTFTDLLSSLQMLKREWGAESKRSYRTHSSLVKLQSWFPSLRWKTFLRQNWSLGSCACSEGPGLGQNTLMMI